MKSKPAPKQPQPLTPERIWSIFINDYDPGWLDAALYWVIVRVDKRKRGEAVRNPIAYIRKSLRNLAEELKYQSCGADRGWILDQGSFLKEFGLKR